MLSATWQVVRFELQRTFTAGRIAMWLTLCLFPALLVATIQIQGRGNVPDAAMIVVSFALVPQISCMLGLLLWATPAIGSEIEAQSWVYLALRPHGRLAVALGKYLVAVIWTASYGLPSAVAVSLLSGLANPLHLTGALIVLVLLSCSCYAALYLLIGALISKRATVIAVIYSLILEGLIAWVPATVNQFTVSYRLWSLLVRWTDFAQLVNANQGAGLTFNSEPSWFNVLALIAYAGLVLALALYVVGRREYPVLSEA